MGNGIDDRSCFDFVDTIYGRWDRRLFCQSQRCRVDWNAKVGLNLYPFIYPNAIVLDASCGWTGVASSHTLQECLTLC